MWVFPLILAMQLKCRMQILYNVFSQILSGLLYSYLSTPLGADEVNGLSLQLINLFMMKVMIWGFVWVTAVSVTSILISSLTSFAPIARKFMCCSCRFSLCVQNWFLCHCKFTFKYVAKWNLCCCLGFCWITDVRCGKMLILDLP